MGLSTDLVALQESENPEVLPTPSGQDQESLAFYINQINAARDQRNQPRREFDDMDYYQDYTSNQLAANSYLRRKINDDDVRVNSGTAEKKIELVLNELLAMNLQPEIRAYDEDDLEVEDLGEDLADVIRRTNEMERDEDLYQDAFLELLTQRAVFIEECFSAMPTLTIRTGKTGKFRNEKFLNKRLLTGLQVFLGDLTIPAYRFQEQPYICTYDRLLYEEAETIYGDLDAWKYVRPGIPMSDAYGLWFKYRLGVLENREVEIIRYFSQGEYQVIINGVMMYTPGTKPYWNHGGYPITMVVLKSMSRFFAYGKPLIASAKFLQGISDETLRNLIRKMRQAIEPPLGVKSGKVYSKDIWSPGAATNGLTKDSFERLIDHDGVTSSEFSMYQLFSSEIDKFVGQNSAGNEPGNGPRTATQIVEEQKQALKQLGLAVLGAMRLKREMTWLRLHSLFQYYFEPVGKTVDTIGKVKPKYRSFTVNDTDIGDGETGKKLIQFANAAPDDPTMQAALDTEESLAQGGQNVRFHVLDVEKLKNAPLTWDVVVTSQERDSGSLDKVLFQDQLAQMGVIMQLTGAQPNKGKLFDSFERKWNVKGLFEREPVATPQSAQPAGTPPQDSGTMPPTSAGTPQPTPMGTQMMPNPAGVQRPSVNTLANA